MRQRISNGINGGEAWMEARPWMGLTIVQIVLLVGLLLPVSLTQKCSDHVMAFVIFVVFAPHLICPFAWIASKLTKNRVNIDKWFQERDIIFSGLFSCILVGLPILLPFVSKADLLQNSFNMGWAMFLMIMAFWPPVIGTIVAVERSMKMPVKQLLTSSRHFKSEDTIVGLSTGFESESIDGDMMRTVEYKEREEKMWLAGLFGTFSLPLTFFLPIYSLGTHTEEGEAAVVFFACLSCSVMSLAVLGPRFSELVWYFCLNRFYKPNVKALVKFGLCGILIPLLGFLPILIHADSLKTKPEKMLLVFIIGLPAVTFLEAMRTKYRNTDPFWIAMALAFLVGVLPLAVFLPIILSTDLSDKGEVALIVLIILPLDVLLLVVLILTIYVNHSLPFIPVKQWHFQTQTLYAVVVTMTPLCILLPVMLHANLSDGGKVVVLVMMCITVTTLLTMFVVSCLWGTSDNNDVEPKSANDFLPMTFIDLGAQPRSSGMISTGMTPNGAASTIIGMHTSPIQNHLNESDTEMLEETLERWKFNQVSDEWEFVDSITAELHLSKLDEKGENPRTNCIVYNTAVDGIDYVIKLYKQHPVLQTEEGMKDMLSMWQESWHIVREFNTEIAKSGQSQEIFLLETFAVKLISRESQQKQVWALMEPDLSASDTNFLNYQKWVTPEGSICTIPGTQMQAPVQLEYWKYCLDIAEAFSCFSYHNSCHDYMALDIRGNGNSYSLPQLHFSASGGGFYGDKGAKVINNFIGQHIHNEICTSVLQNVGCKGLCDPLLTSNFEYFETDSFTSNSIDCAYNTS